MTCIKQPAAFEGHIYYPFFGCWRQVWLCADWSDHWQNSRVLEWSPASWCAFRTTSTSTAYITMCITQQSRSATLQQSEKWIQIELQLPDFAMVFLFNQLTDCEIWAVLPSHVVKSFNRSAYLLVLFLFLLHLELEFSVKLLQQQSHNCYSFH